MAYEVSGNYHHDQLDYAWKTLMQNHLTRQYFAGCSVDSCHREMIPVLNADEVGKYACTRDSFRTALTALSTTTGFLKDSFHLAIVENARPVKTGKKQNNK